MQNKPQMVEAVLFFDELGVCKQMLFAEFEAVLDGVVDLPGFADRQMRAVYVLINPRLQVRSAVFFFLDFDPKGAADPGWNIPLRHLADRAGRGPDLGGGPIRLACRSQTPVAWLQLHLWEPSVERGDFQAIRDAVQRNSLGLLAEEETALPAMAPERLQVAAEDAWYADPSQELVEKLTEQMGLEHRQKIAVLVKQQRLRLASLGQNHEEELARVKQTAERQHARLLDEVAALQQALAEQEMVVSQWQARFAEQAESFQKSREEMTRQLRAIERNGRIEADVLRAQFEAQLEERIALAVADYREQIAVRDVELAYRDELDTQLQEDIERLKREQTRAMVADRRLEQLAELGVVLVVYHPGAGHLTIPQADVPRYLENPQAYAAGKCFVSEAQYREWLAHYQQPTCDAVLPGGERCGAALERIDIPGRYVVGESCRCDRHKASQQLRTAG
ncbi:chromosome partitioning protein ParA [Pseudomonas kuykendallii]|uniref:Chromosome partitioning protein ParA n=1 Tax=Pseudomonas kuykendallii TaxID=1007099 RepID=A0A2W5F7F2_9PSED|nr:chromosome partitioning protein ParA [Pseudomonas kuykendallii]PZP25589.1 MAG: chromosome partitioning protein ParA [Pseudomonas kuykendallii]